MILYVREEVERNELNFELDMLRLLKPIKIEYSPY